jgi:hypothetical protein
MMPRRSIIHRSWELDLPIYGAGGSLQSQPMYEVTSNDGTDYEFILLEGFQVDTVGVCGDRFPDSTDDRSPIVAVLSKWHKLALSNGANNSTFWFTISADLDENDYGLLPPQRVVVKKLVEKLFSEADP